MKKTITIGLYKKSETDNTKFLVFKWLADAKNNTLTFDKPVAQKDEPPEPTSWYSFASPIKSAPSKPRGGSGGPVRGGGGRATTPQRGSGIGAPARGMVKNTSGGSGQLARKTPPNTEWEFRLFPLRTVYIDVARASFSDKKKSKKRNSLTLPEDKEKERPMDHHDGKGGEGEGKREKVGKRRTRRTILAGNEGKGLSDEGDEQEESIFSILHRRFAPLGELSERGGMK